jgi:hypothetical protein
MVKAVGAVAAGRVPPEAEITGPDWYDAIDPGKASFALRGEVFARGAPYRCRVEVAPGSAPNNAAVAAGDFERVASSWCDGGPRARAYSGVLADIDLARLKARFPPDAGDFRGREPPPAAPNFNNRPNQEPYGFTVRVVVTTGAGADELTGQDRRNLYLHRDRDLLTGWPLKLPSDGASSPALADLDGDGRNELVLATGDGVVHALRRNGHELPGWPVHADPLPFLHPAGRAFASGEVAADSSYGSILASVAVGDLDRDGAPEVVAADLEGKVYAWRSSGAPLWKRSANPAYSGRPLQPFQNVRYVRDDPPASQTRRTQHGFIASPVLADLDGDGGPLEVVAAGMDRHLYAWSAGGAPRGGFPALVADRSKVSAVDAATHALTFKPGVGAELQQGPIVDTPALADIAGDGRLEIVVGTNEEYTAAEDGGFNAGNVNTASFSLLANVPGGPFKTANGRLYAIDAGGEVLDGWPAKVGILLAELLPIVGEGITGSPVVAPLTCPSGGPGQKIGVIPAAGPGYVFNADGTSCHGSSGGHDNALQSDFAVGFGKFDTPAIPAVGQPAFGRMAGGTAFLAPATGLIRALDVAANEYQGGQDFVAAWDATTGQFRPGWPSPVNDLQFLTGPSVADVDGRAGEEILGGTASLDLNALNAAGAPASTAWPKLTTDWSVTNPVIGTFGTRATDPAARKVVVHATRSGYVFAYRTPAASDAPASWPRFHHDNANSGWLRGG